jgi:hypothetical protein
MLMIFTTFLGKTMPSSAADTAFMTDGKVADHLNVAKRIMHRVAGTSQFVIQKLV